MRNKQSTKLALVLSVLMVAGTFIRSGIAHAEDVEVQKITRIEYVGDPHAFRTAQLMYRTASMLPFDRNAEQLLGQVSASLANGALLESKEVWESLTKLNPYRKSEQVQAAVGKIAAGIAERVKKESVDKLPLGFKEANAAYKSEQYLPASEKYIAVLQQAPSMLDARNNLALAQMHLGNDLLAQVELETIRCLDAGHAAASVNLAVVYERIGLRQKALEHAEASAKLHENIQAARFNSAWYQSEEGKIESAKADLNALVKLDEKNTKYADLRAIVKKQYKELPFRTKGLFGVVGLKGSFGRNAIALILFVLLSCGMLVWLFLYMFSSPGALLISMAVPFAWYVFLWGLPSGVAWTFPVLFTFASIVSLIAIKRQLI